METNEREGISNGAAEERVELHVHLSLIHI